MCHKISEFYSKNVYISNFKDENITITFLPFSVIVHMKLKIRYYIKYLKLFCFILRILHFLNYQVLRLNFTADIKNKNSPFSSAYVGVLLFKGK